MRFLASISITIMALMITATARADDGAFTIGTGTANGNYYSVGGALCRMVNRDEAMRCLTQRTAGSIDNLYALDLGDIDFAIMQADVQAAAFRGSSRIPGGPHSDLRSVFALYDETLTVVVLAGSDIDAFSDLRGRRVNRGDPNSGSRWTFDAVLQAHGISPNELFMSYADTTNDAANDLCDGRIDAIAMVSGHPSAWLARLANMCRISILSPDRQAIAALTALSAGYFAVETPGGLYPFMQETTATIGTEATIVTLAETDDEVVTTLMTAIYADIGNFRRQQIVLDENSPSLDGLTAPLHPAAKRFFDEGPRVP